MGGPVRRLGTINMARPRRNCRKTCCAGRLGSNPCLVQRAVQNRLCLVVFALRSDTPGALALLAMLPCGTCPMVSTTMGGAGGASALVAILLVGRLAAMRRAPSSSFLGVAGRS